MNREKLIWVIGNEYHNPDHAINPETHWVHYLPEDYRVINLTEKNLKNVDIIGKLHNMDAKKWGTPHFIYVSFVPLDPTDTFEFYRDDDWDRYKAPFNERVNWYNLAIKEIAVLDTVLKHARALAPTVYTMNALSSNLKLPDDHISGRSLYMAQSHSMNVDLLQKQPHEINEYDYKLFAKTLIEEMY